MIAVKGKKEAVSIFTLVGDSKFKDSTEFKNLEKSHIKILNSYFSKNRSPLFLSETIKFRNWEELNQIRDISDNQIHEGVMIK